MIERKDLKFFHVALISTGLGQHLTQLAHNEIFMSRRLKTLIAFCSLMAHMVAILTL